MAGLGFEETELQLGVPGGGNDAGDVAAARKRGEHRPQAEVGAAGVIGRCARGEGSKGGGGGGGSYRRRRRQPLPPAEVT
jgi:hypothetical protein